MKTRGIKHLTALVLILILLTQAVLPAALAAETGDFLDVPEAAYYRAAVDWAAREGITQGTSTAAFSPDDHCTRGQVVTFLWRAAGKPEQGSENPFTDVKAGDYFYEAVLWAVSQGITDGTSASTFSPEDVCTRAQIVTFLWRAQGKPESTGAELWYADAVAWAESSGLLSGTGEDFTAEDICPRRDVVYYLWGASVGTPELLSRGGRTMNNVRYVLIYNPMIWSEDNGRITGPLVSTGNLEGQVDVDYNRSALPEEKTRPVPMPVEDDPLLGSDLVDLSGVRAGGPDPSYSLGDTHTFYTYNYNRDSRIQRTFTCVYAGTSCYIWSYEGSVSSGTAEVLGREFDSVIYPQDLQLFGQPRFTENGGKINILCYPVVSWCAGFFTSLDNYATGEISQAKAEERGMNLDHAIITINAEHVDGVESMKPTLAHELQHQILHSDVLRQAKSPGMKSWLNEAMSTYAEQAIYPDSETDYNEFRSYFQSGLFRNSQSLYHFKYTDSDFGCYGAVRLFSRYFATYTTNPFWYVHEYWRSQNRASLSSAEALYYAAYSGWRDWIDANYRYSSFVSDHFSVKYDEWLSKLTLDFYLKSLNANFCGISYDRMKQLYEQAVYTGGSLSLEGGGRIIVPVYGDSFTVPEDAGSVLVYVGLDENFNPVDTIGINETGAPQTQPKQQHSYSFVFYDSSTWYEDWHKAKDMGGYLCTLDSEDEFLYLNNYIESQGWYDIAFYLGAFRAPGAQDIRWVDSGYGLYGTPLNSPDHWMRRYWFYGEPTYTYDGRDECFVVMEFPSDFERAGFNDIADLPYENLGFIVEYDN